MMTHGDGPPINRREPMLLGPGRHTTLEKISNLRESLSVGCIRERWGKSMPTASEGARAKNGQPVRRCELAKILIRSTLADCLYIVLIP